MFLKNVKSKGNIYVYLCAYNQENQDRKCLFSFGRIDQALKKMCRWKGNSSEFPVDLFEMGCCISDLDTWIDAIEKKVKKTSEPIKSII